MIRIPRILRTSALLSLALWLTLSAAVPAFAHRVNIFAYVEGNDILVECSFSRSQKVKQGKIEVRDATTDAMVVQGKTDDAGVFRFAVTPQMRKAGHDLVVRIVAGEGHQNDWTIAASEFVTAPPAPAELSGAGSPEQAPAPAPTLSPASPASPAPLPAPLPAQALTAADVERIVNTALDAKLSPLKHMLASQVEAGPSLKDIVGGIGWIFGLVGVAAYFRRRP